MYNSRPSIPAVTKNLLIINTIMWVASLLFSSKFDLANYLGLHYWEAEKFNAAQLFTYMFMHDTGGITHLFFNMFSLFMFGVILERVMGAKRFLLYYISCGVGAAIVQELVWTFTWQSTFVDVMAQLNSVSASDIEAAMGPLLARGDVDAFQNMLCTVGASGAVFGILLAFGMLFPNQPMYLMFIPIPIKAKWMVIGYGAIELFFGISHTMQGVAHYAHLGGMLFGFIIIMYWKKKGMFNGGWY